MHRYRLGRHGCLQRVGKAASAEDGVVMGSGLLGVAAAIAVMALVGIYFTQFYTPYHPGMSETLCKSVGGNWNNCSSRCIGEPPGTICTLECVPQCECGGIAGFSCPTGYYCKTSGSHPDELGRCIAEARPGCFTALNCVPRERSKVECISGTCVYSPV